MSEKKQFMILAVLAILSIALLIYATTNVGANFTNQF